MGHSRADKEATHSRIVKIAAKRFRELGLDGIGVADVMKEAGMTVGGFYKHFASRDHLVVEAIAEAFKGLDVQEGRAGSVAHHLRNYLTEAHRDAPGTGCAMAALLGDIGRASNSARAIYTARVISNLEFYTSLLPGGDCAAKRARGLLILSASLGALELSRALSDPALSKEVLDTVEKQLTALSVQEVEATRSSPSNARKVRVVDTLADEHTA